MSCSDRHDLISAYLDGELRPAERETLEQHLASCAPCRARAASLRSLKHAVARLEGRARPPEAVLARVDALRFQLKPSRAHVVRRAVLGSAAAAAIVLAFAAGRAWFHEGGQLTLVDELIADHLKYVPEAMPAEVASDQPEEVRRFFAGKVPFDPVVPAIDGASLIGGRLCRLRGYYEQLLFYERAGRKLSLYVSNRPDTLTDCDGQKGYHVCGDRRRGLSLMLVGDAPRDELQALLGSARL